MLIMTDGCSEYKDPRFQQLGKDKGLFLYNAYQCWLFFVHDFETIIWTISKSVPSRAQRSKSDNDCWEHAWLH